LIAIQLRARAAGRVAQGAVGLSPDERAVMLALGHPRVVTWAEAAMAAGAADPERQGDKVRRKVKRLAARITSRSSQGEGGTVSGR
jgi:hypothetical protein